MTNQFAQPGGEATAESNQTNMIVLAVAAVCGIIGFRLLAPWLGGFLNRRVGPSKVEPAAGAQVEREDKLISEFVASFAAEPSATPGRAASEERGSPSQVLPAAEAAISKGPSDPVGEFLSGTQNNLAAVRKLISEVSQADDEAGRGKLLRELLDHIRSLRSSSCLPQVLPVWQMACALEGLLRQLTDKPDNVNPSTLRTVASAVDLLHALCVRGLDPNLGKDPPVRLLAVYDDAISRHLMEVALKKALTQPDLAADGEGALRLAAAQTYDVIFLDVQMPEMDGFELCSRIHGTVSNQTTPVVFVTHFCDLDARAKSCLVGGEDLLGKPFLIFELATKALTLVLRRRLQAHRSGQMDLNFWASSAIKLMDHDHIRSLPLLIPLFITAALVEGVPQNTETAAVKPRVGSSYRSWHAGASFCSVFRVVCWRRSGAERPNATAPPKEEFEARYPWASSNEHEVLLVGLSLCHFQNPKNENQRESV
jgi:CheY-like chemotaxis protein